MTCDSVQAAGLLQKLFCVCQCVVPFPVSFFECLGALGNGISVLFRASMNEEMYFSLPVGDDFVVC